MRKALLFIYILSRTIFPIGVQTCCSGGVPIASNIPLPPSEKGMLQITSNYDLNTLKTLKSGSDKLNDDSRER